MSDPKEATAKKVPADTEKLPSKVQLKPAAKKVSLTTVPLKCICHDPIPLYCFVHNNPNIAAKVKRDREAISQVIEDNEDHENDSDLTPKDDGAENGGDHGDHPDVAISMWKHIIPGRKYKAFSVGVEKRKRQGVVLVPIDDI